MAYSRNTLLTSYSFLMLLEILPYCIRSQFFYLPILAKGLEVLEEEEWEIEKDADDVKIKSKVGNHGRKLWLCEAKVNVTPELLEKKLLDIDNLAKWNTTVTESRIIKNVSDKVFITYKVFNIFSGTPLIINLF